VVDRGPLLATHRDKIKPDIIWNTEKGLALKPEQIAWAERERSAFYRRMLVNAKCAPHYIKTVLSQAGAEAAIIEYGLSELEAVQKRLAEAPVSYVDLAANRVVIEVADQAAGERLVKAAGVDPAAVTVVVSAAQPELSRDLYGGDTYYAGNSRCTVGFTARKGSRPGFITAGHCGRVGTHVTAADRTPLGVFRDSVFPGRDMAWVEVGPEWTLRGAVRSGSQIFPVRGSRQAPVGSAVCRTGSTTGWHCGTIQQHNVTVSYPQGTVSGLTRTSLCAEPGDSGGPVLSGDQAQGIISGGSGNCRTGGSTFYQPVNPILHQYGLTLVTGG
jgi:streptogrisin C